MENVLFFVYGNLTNPRIVSKRLQYIRPNFRYTDARIRDFILLRFGARGKYDTIFPFKGGATWGKLLKMRCKSSQEVLRKLDEYEGVPKLYERYQFLTNDDRWCYVYISNPREIKIQGMHSAVSRDVEEVIERGGWEDYIQSTGKKPLIEVGNSKTDWYEAIQITPLSYMEREVLRIIKKSPRRVPLKTIFEKLGNEVRNTIRSLLSKQFIRQDGRDRVPWHDNEATFFTEPSKREIIERKIGKRGT